MDQGEHIDPTLKFLLVIFTIIFLLICFWGIPSSSTIKSETRKFEVAKIHKDNSLITLYGKDGEIIKLKRADEGRYLWENDTIEIGDKYNLKINYNYYNIIYEKNLDPYIE